MKGGQKKQKKTKYCRGFKTLSLSLSLPLDQIHDIKQHADTLAIVYPADGLGKDGSDVEDFHLGAACQMLLLGDTVADNNLINARVLDSGNGISRHDGVGDDGVDLLCSVLLKDLGGLGNGERGVGNIVDQDADLVLDISNQHHVGLVRSLDLTTLFVNQSKLHAQLVGNDGRTLGSTGIGRDNDSILPVGDLVANVFDHQGLSVQVVNGDIKETLELRVVQIHRDNMIRT